MRGWDSEIVQLNHRLRHADGSTHCFSQRATPFRRDSNGMVTQLVGALRDITDAMGLQSRLEYEALHDSLTGLPNRALLIDRLNIALARSRGERREVAVLFCDLDSFKRVNDTAGHADGDVVLQEAAQRLQSVLRDGDTVARVGGDEFVIIVEPWNREDSRSIKDPLAVEPPTRCLPRCSRSASPTPSASRSRSTVSNMSSARASESRTPGCHDPAASPSHR